MSLSRPLVQATLAPRVGPPTEVLDDVRDEHRAAIDAGLSQGFVQHSTGRPDERLAGQVLAIAGLLADEHQPRPLRAVARHRLGRVGPKLAGSAAGRSGAQPVEVESAGGGRIRESDGETGILDDDRRIGAECLGRRHYPSAPGITG
jgi:hypothetical protein